MYKQWAMMVTVAGMAMGSTGCYYDQWQGALRSNGVLEQEVARVADDLQNAEYMNAQKDTTIASLRNELKTKGDLIASLQAEIDMLDELAKGLQDIVAQAAGPGPPPTVIFRDPALPAALHEDLQKLAAEHSKILSYDEKTGAVQWKSDLLFGLGSDLLEETGESAEALKAFAGIVSSEAAAKFDVIVVGHTCTTPIRKDVTQVVHKTNWHLSAHRAISVMSFLGKHQVAMTRMGVMGYGEHRPIAANPSARVGNPKNRRVEIFLVPKESVQAVSRGIHRVPGRDLAFARPAALGR